MKKKMMISLLMVMTIFCSILSPALAATTAIEKTCYVVNDINKNEFVILEEKTTNFVTVNVYKDGMLIQRSTANAITNQIQTEIFTLESPGARKSEQVLGMQNTIIYKQPVSEAFDISSFEGKVITSTTRALLTEPVTNEGLLLSQYNDGTYYLGNAGGFYSYASNVYGYLYRSYTSIYEGVTSTWQWGMGTTMSAIIAAVSLALGVATGSGIVMAILGVLAFTADGIISYNTAVKLETYTFNYNYKVRVPDSVWLTATRNITYWKVNNTTTGVTTWNQKSFNYGTPLDNMGMIQAGVDNYLASIY